MASDLKPCPFCGVSLRISGDLATCDTAGCFCERMSVATDVQRHVAAWNRRTPADLSAAEAAAAREMREACVAVCRAFVASLEPNGVRAVGQNTRAWARAVESVVLSIEARQIPAPGALERYVAGKVAEEREAIAAWHDEKAAEADHFVCRAAASEDKGMHRTMSQALVLHRNSAAAIRARGAEARQAGEVGEGDPHAWKGEGPPPPRWTAADGTIVYRSYGDYVDD